MADHPHMNRRRHERFSLAPMYTTVVAEWMTPQGRCESAGHAYDVSEGGLRMELDERLEPGTVVNITMCLPGQARPIRASGAVVRTYDEADDPGPCRVALQLDRFHTPLDRQALFGCLGSGALPRAA
jgi:hypothetical protein